jgi:tripartite ATP-independent transporter DctP family solute receptor
VKALSTTLKMMAFSLIFFTFIASSVNAKTLKLAHCVKPDPDGPYQATALKFKELVENYTDKRIKIKIFPQRQLGDDRAILEGVRDGLIEIGLVTMGPIGAFDSRVDLLELPFLFKNTDHLDQVIEGPIGEKLLNMDPKSGLIGLGYSVDGNSNITNSKRPIKSVDDFKGLQMRAIEAPVRIATLKALGANPIPIAYAELYTALSTGVADGQSNPNWVITARSLHEVQKYISVTQHIWAGTMLLTSPDTLAKFSPEDQASLKKAAFEAGRYGRSVYRKGEETHLQKAIENGMIVEYNPDIASMMEATKSVYTDVFKKHPDWEPIVDDIRQAGQKL